MRIGTDGLGNMDFDSIPPNAPDEHTELINYIDKWRVAGLVPFMQEQADGVCDEILTCADQMHPWENVSLPSVIPYYETLPKFYREHRAVVSLVNLLEKNFPTMPRG
jgi:hypothetical protein